MTAKYHGAILKASKSTGRWDLVLDSLLPGAHLILVGDLPNWEEVCVQVRKVGLSLRDTLAVVSSNGVRFCPLFRKDLDKATVHLQVTSTGTGALNIDATRIRMDGESTGGRWPSNVLFEHKSSCVREGTKKVKGSQLDQMIDRNLFYGGAPRAPSHCKGYTGADGKETVPNWKCAPGCPVHALDSQSAAMGMHSAGNKNDMKHTKGNTLYSGALKPVSNNPDYYQDEGGASRFFKQCVSEEELLAYFKALLIPSGDLLLTEFPE